MEHSILDRIAAYKREEIATAKRARPSAVVEAATRAAPAPRGFLHALRAAQNAGRIGLIAEVKRASPSKGLIRADFDPAALAHAYTQGGATCLSVLTDGPSFQGSLAHLTAAREAALLPLLRKDFMLDPYQVTEARAAGADCILIIVAMVTPAEANALIASAKSFGMDWLIEVHDERELDAALELDSPMIGINNRDLNTFKTDLGTTLRLAPVVPRNRLLVSESGIAMHADVAQLAAAGIAAILVGESLMREADVAAATRALIAPVPA
jgi:indole-3-glycerol phosphate synthase